MASKIVPVIGTDWTELSQAQNGCFENQTGSALKFWVSDTKPDASQTQGHELAPLADKGFQLDTASNAVLWARTLNAAGSVIVTEY